MGPIRLRCYASAAILSVQLRELLGDLAAKASMSANAPWYTTATSSPKRDAASVIDGIGLVGETRDRIGAWNGRVLVDRTLPPDLDRQEARLRRAAGRRQPCTGAPSSICRGRVVQTADRARHDAVEIGGADERTDVQSHTDRHPVPAWVCGGPGRKRTSAPLGCRGLDARYSSEVYGSGTAGVWPSRINPRTAQAHSTGR